MPYVLRLSLKRRWFFLPLIALIAALVITLGTWFYHPFQARAGGTGPIIDWDSSMIYAGQNNGNPWGPVGENAIVHGANFLANVQISIVLVQGNSNQTPSLCKAPVATVGTVTTSSAGTFELSFSWPSRAGTVNSIYSVCSTSTGTGLTVSYRDDGPFTVLSAGAPAISVSPNSVQPGTTITVSGHNWVPPQQVTISVTGSSQLVSATPTSSGQNTGTFSITLNIPSSAQPGSYVVSAFTGNNALHAGNQNISITTPTPTATPSPTPSPTATVTATPTGTATVTATGATTAGPGNTPTNAPAANSSNSGSSSGGGPSGLVLGVLAAIALVLLTSIGLVVFMVMHRSSPQQKRPAAPGRHALAGQYNGGAFANNGNPASPNGAQGNAPQAGFAISNQSTSSWQQQQTSSPNLYNQSTLFAPPSTGYEQPAPGTFSPNSQGYQPPASPMPAGGANPAQGTIAPSCMNCGRPLLPNAMRCDACGMPTGLYPGW